jgi:hypothetical protein
LAAQACLSYRRTSKDGRSTEQIERLKRYIETGSPE